MDITSEYEKTLFKSIGESKYQSSESFPIKRGLTIFDVTWTSKITEENELEEPIEANIEFIRHEELNQVLSLYQGPAGSLDMR